VPTLSRQFFSLKHPFTLFWAFRPSFFPCQKKTLFLLNLSGRVVFPPASSLQKFWACWFSPLTSKRSFSFLDHAFGAPARLSPFLLLPVSISRSPAIKPPFLDANCSPLSPRAFGSGPLFLAKVPRLSTFFPPWRWIRLLGLILVSGNFAPPSQVLCFFSSL